MSEPTRVLIVEDHATVRDALAYVFDRELGYTVVGKAGSLEEARRFPGEFDVAIVDLGLPDGDGVDLVGDLRQDNPQATLLVLSANPERAQFARAVEAGASGFLHKSTPLVEILDAVKRLSSGEALLSVQEVMELMRLAAGERERTLHAQTAARQLTPREREVLQALTDGLNDQEIGERLHIAYDTVRAHLGSIMRKLEADSRLQAVLRAARYGIVEIQ